MRCQSTNASLAVVVFAVAFAVLFAGRSYSGAGDTLPAENLPLALLRNGGPDFRGLVPEDSRIAYGFVVREGRVVSVYPLLAGILHCPVAFAAHAAGVDIRERRIGLARLTAAWVAAAATSTFFLALAAFVRRRTALIFSAVFLFGTEVFSVAGRGLWQHGPALLFTCVSLALLARGGRLVPWAGASLALAVAARPTVLLLAVSLTAWVFRHHRREFIAFLLLAALPAGAVIVYSAAWLGSPFAMGQVLTVRQFGVFRVEALLGLLASPSRGLFVFSPVLLVGLLGLGNRQGSDNGRSLVLHGALFVPSLVLLCSFWPSWWGGHSFGYRLLSELIPVLLLPAAIAWETSRRRLRALALALAALSFSVHALGAYAPSDFNWVPDDIDSNPSRLWNVRDSDLARRIRGVLPAGPTSSAPP